MGTVHGTTVNGWWRMPDLYALHTSRTAHRSQGTCLLRSEDGAPGRKRKAGARKGRRAGGPRGRREALQIKGVEEVRTDTVLERACSKRKHGARGQPGPC